MLKFYVNVFRTSLFPSFQTLWYICFMFDMMIDAGPKFYVVRYSTPYMTLRSRSRTFCIKFLKMSVFVKPLMYWFMFGMVIETGPKFYMVPFPTQKVTDLEFLYKSLLINVLQFHFFAKPSMDFIQLWRDDRALSKILNHPNPSAWP